MAIIELQVSGYQVLGEISWVIPNSGLYLIQGINKDKVTCRSNGTGKSTLFDAIYYARYEQTIKDLSVKELVNDTYAENRKGMFVRVRERFDADNVYDIIRSRGHEEYGTGLTILHNNVDIRTHIKGDLAAHLPLILRESLAEYRASTYITNDMSNKFTSLTDRARKAVIEKTFDLESKEIYEKKSLILFEEKQRYHTELVNKLRDLKTQCSTMSESLDNLRKSKLAAEEQNQQVENKTELIVNLESNVAPIQHYIEEMQTYIQAQEQALQSYVTLLNGLTEKKLHGTVSLTELKERHKYVQQDVDNLKELLKTGLCFTCKQTIRPQEFEPRLIEVQTALDELFIQLSTSETVVKDTQLDIDTNSKLKCNLETHIAQQKNAIQPYIDSVAEYRLQINTLRELQKTTVDYDRLIEDLEGQIEIVKQNIAAQEITNQKYADTELPYYKLATRIFDSNGIRVVLLEHYIHIVNEKLLELCNKIGMGDIIVQLVFEGRKTAKIIVTVPNQRGGFGRLSDGERRYADFLIQYAFYLCTIKQTSPFLILDEVFLHIDDQRLRYIFEYLDETAQTRPIFVITHNEFAKSLIPNVITLVRENGVTEFLR